MLYWLYMEVIAWWLYCIKYNILKLGLPFSLTVYLLECFRLHGRPAVWLSSSWVDAFIVRKGLCRSKGWRVWKLGGSGQSPMCAGVMTSQAENWKKEAFEHIVVDTLSLWGGQCQWAWSGRRDVCLTWRRGLGQVWSCHLVLTAPEGTWGSPRGEGLGVNLSDAINELLLGSLHLLPWASYSASDARPLRMNI